MNIPAGYQQLLMFPDLKQRVLDQEILDTVQPSLDDSREIYYWMSFVNLYLGGRGALLGHIRKWSRRWSPDHIVRILDVGCGDGDLVKSILNWSCRQGFSVHWTLLDQSPVAITLARENLAEFKNVEFIEGSAFDMPFGDASFDYVVSSLFLHHVEPQSVAGLLCKMSGISKRGMVINDLRRHLCAYYGFRFLSSLTLNPIFQYDGALSVLRGFKKDELLEICKIPGLEYLKYQEHWAFRFTLAGEKDAAV